MNCYNHPDRAVPSFQPPGYHFDGRYYHPICDECASRAPEREPHTGDPLQADYSYGPRGDIYYCGQLAYKGKENAK